MRTSVFSSPHLEKPHIPEPSTIANWPLAYKIIYHLQLLVVNLSRVTTNYQPQQTGSSRDITIAGKT